VIVKAEAPPDVAPTGWTYRVELGSFATESDAAELRTRVAGELEGPLATARDLATGRFLVRLGNFADESSASAALRSARTAGFESAAVVREPAVVPRANGFLLAGRGSLPLRIQGESLTAMPATRDGFLEVDGDAYRGYLEIKNGSRALTVVNVVNLEDYLQGVVPAELSPDAFPEKEALKAQAIAARTYAAKRMGEYASEGYDICATPACQVYRGYGAERPLSNAAVAETEGEILTFDGEPVEALYTSTCGGRTENAENVFSKAEPYLVSRACFLESRASALKSTGGKRLSLEAAVLERLQVLDAIEERRPAARDETVRWLGAALRLLGESACWSGRAAEGDQPVVDPEALASLLSEALCWDRRLPFLVSAADAERIVGRDVPDGQGRIALAYAIRSGLIVPGPEGLRLGEALSTGEVVRTLHALIVKRGEPPLRDGRIRTAGPDRITLVEEDRETSMSVDAGISLFREVAGAASPVSEILLLPNDRVRYRTGDSGIDLLVLLEDGASFDRSSRFSHWMVRKTVEEVSQGVNASLPTGIGTVIELRPKRYGASGRLAELEVVGTEGTGTLRGLAIRRALGIRENLFFLDRQSAPDGTARGWVFTGRGWGHGVGLCQVGAYGMAASGFSYRDILGHYYPGTRIDKRSGRP
jgi:stage II sporulation protein D